MYAKHYVDPKTKKAMLEMTSYLKKAFKEDMLESTYSNVNLRECATNLKSLYQRGTYAGVLKPQEWKAAWRQMDLLLRFIGV
jgi:hypothetical protein